MYRFSNTAELAEIFSAEILNKKIVFATTDTNALRRASWMIVVC